MWAQANDICGKREWLRKSGFEKNDAPWTEDCHWLAIARFECFVIFENSTRLGLYALRLLPDLAGFDCASVLLLPNVLQNNRQTCSLICRLRSKQRARWKSSLRALWIIVVEVWVKTCTITCMGKAYFGTTFSSNSGWLAGHFRTLSRTAAENFIAWTVLAQLGTTHRRKNFNSMGERLTEKLRPKKRFFSSLLFALFSALPSALKASCVGNCGKCLHFVV